MSNPTILLTRGFPGSGKTTFAKAYVAEDPNTRARINRDDIRMALFGYKQGLTRAQEQTVTSVEDALARTLIEDGYSIVVDSMHLARKYITRWYNIAAALGVKTVEVQEFKVSPEEILQRNQTRPAADRLPQAALEDMLKRFRTLAPVIPFEKFQVGKQEEGPVVTPAPPVDWSRKRTVVFDVDGTLMLNESGRGWFDYSRVLDDTPNTSVVHLAKALANDGWEIVVVSGREDTCEADTRESLRRAGVPFSDLFMRETDDHRVDSKVKYEIYDQYLRDHNVALWVDDRPSVIRMVEQLGIRVLNVGKLGVEF